MADGGGCKWESVRGLSEHRGSHGAAAVGAEGLVMAVGGGGMRANLSSAEILGAQKTAPLFVPFSFFFSFAPSLSGQSASFIYTTAH
jgi:hypothetical protein